MNSVSLIWCTANKQGKNFEIMWILNRNPVFLKKIAIRFYPENRFLVFPDRFSIAITIAMKML